MNTRAAVSDDSGVGPMRSSRTIRLIVTCTDRKTLVAPDERLMRNVPGDPDARWAEWSERITPDATSSSAAPALPARNLYSGEHWSVVDSIEPTIGPWNVELWIASAGLGLIPASAEVQAYGATFSSGAADSITRGVPAEARRAYNSAWWSALASYSRSITALARTNPRAPLVFAGSPAYLHPLAEDLEAATAELTGDASMFIITSGASSIPGAVMLRVEDRLATPEGLGGSLVSVNARLARWLIQSAEEHSFNPIEVQNCLDSLLESCPDRPKFDRERVDVEDVKHFIRSEFQLAATEQRQVLSHSSLLRKFRDSGKACEQKKFGALYKEVANETKGMS